MAIEGLTKVNAWNQNKFGENYFNNEVGPTINSNTNGNTNSNTNSNTTGNNFMSSMGGMDNMMQMGQQIDQMMSTLGNKVIAGGKTSTAGKIISALPGGGFFGGVINALVGSKLNEENINKFKNENNAYNKVTYGSDSSSEVLSNFASSGDLASIIKKDVGSDGVFSNKAKTTTNGLNYDRQNANAHKQAALIQSAADLDAKTDSALVTNYAAYGGLLSNRFDDGGGFNDWWQNQGSNQFFGAWGNPSQTNQARIDRQSGYTNAASKFGGSNNAMAYAAAAQSIGNNIINWKDEDYVNNNLGSNAGQASQALFGIANMLTKKKDNQPTLEDKIGLAYGGPVNKFALGGSDYSQIAATAVNLANNFAVQSDTKNIDDIQSQIRRRGNVQFTGNSNNELLNSWNDNYKAYNSNLSDSDFRDKSWAHDVVNGVQAGVEGSTTGFQTGGVAGAIVGGVLGTGSSIAGSLIGRSRAKKKRQALATDIANTNERQVRTFDVMRGNLDRSNDLNARALDYAFGGPFKNRYADGGYVSGQTYDLDESEIQALVDAGYHIQYE